MPRHKWAGRIGTGKSCLEQGVNHDASPWGDKPLMLGHARIMCDFKAALRDKNIVGCTVLLSFYMSCLPISFTFN